MKKAVRLLSLVLALVMCALTLAACGGDSGETTPAGTTASTTGPATNKWADVDLSNSTIRIAYNDYLANTWTASGATNSLPFLTGPDDEGLLSRADYLAAYERHNRVCDELGLEMGENLIYTNLGWDGKIDEIITDIQAYNTADSDSAPNIILHTNYGMVRAGILGELYNCKDQSQKNYFDFTNDNWYNDMMLENTLDANKFYMLMGDYFIDQFRFAYGILVNSEIADEVLAIDGGLNHIYDLVKAGDWDYDKMMEISDFAYTGDQGENLVMGAIGDQGWVVRTFFASSGLDVFIRDENGVPAYIEGTNIDPVHDWLDKIIAMAKEDHFSNNWIKDTRNTAKDQVATTFINGGALFAINQPILTLEGNLVQNMDSPAGIIPTPKYNATNTELGYKSLVSDNANAGGILISSDPSVFTASSAFIQMMTEESDEFFTQYFENGLKYKNNDIGTGHIEMLDIIHDSICSPMSFLYDNYCGKAAGYSTYSAIMYPCIDNQSNVFSSQWTTELGAKQSLWSQIIANFGTRTN